MVRGVPDHISEVDDRVVLTHGQRGERGENGDSGYTASSEFHVGLRRVLESATVPQFACSVRRDGRKDILVFSVFFFESGVEEQNQSVLRTPPFLTRTEELKPHRIAESGRARAREIRRLNSLDQDRSSSSEVLLPMKRR